MVVKKLKELYQVDTISQDKGWGKINSALSDLTEDIEIDFDNINVVEPWQCPEFRKLLRNKHVYLSFVNSEHIVNRIQMVCIIDGIDHSRVRNRVVDVVKKKTQEEKKIENYGRELVNFFKLSDSEAILDLEKKYSQIQSTNTLDYIDYAIRYINDKHSINNFTLKVGRIVILPNVLQAIANMMVQYESEGLHLFMDCDDVNTQKNMGLCIHIATNDKYNTDERKIAISKTLKNNSPGMLIKYKKSKALDEFGREGKGEVVSSRIAIFRGIKEAGDEQVTAEIEVFNSNYFYTADHWLIEHDYEELKNLHSDLLSIPLEELGVCDLFLGSKYHFINPIQQNESETRVIIKEIDDNGKNIKVKCTIPERMKIVFDSWGIEYDKDILDKYINDTKEHLEKVKNRQISKIEGINI